MPLLSCELQNEILQTIAKICQPGKGILAADETPAAMEDRFQALGITNTEENRRAYRELLFTCKKTDINGLSAVILHDETINQQLTDGRSMIQAVKDLDLVPGITLDKGWRSIPAYPGEVYTQGMDDLYERCAAYKKIGAKFAKWRMVVELRDDLPSQTAVIEGVRSLALYANICQVNGLVPIVEPDFNRVGSHDIDKSKSVIEWVLVKLFEALNEFKVLLEGIILKISMVTPGKNSPKQASPDEVARATLETFSRTVPSCVPAIVFLSGGLTSDEATANLNAINRLSNQTAKTFPWLLTFCFGRALQETCRKAWMGKKDNLVEAQKEFSLCVGRNSHASRGQFNN